MLNILAVSFLVRVKNLIKIIFHNPRFNPQLQSHLYKVGIKIFIKMYKYIYIKMSTNKAKGNNKTKRKGMAFTM